MGRRKQYQDEKHAADAKRKAEKRAKDKKKSLANLSKEQIITQILHSLADDIVDFNIPLHTSFHFTRLTF